MMDASPPSPPNHDSDTGPESEESSGSIETENMEGMAPRQRVESLRLHVMNQLKRMGKSQNQETDSSDSDVEDATYLREMCSGFTKKIKEKNAAIKIYRKVLFNNQVQLVKREAAYQRKLRKILLGNRISNNYSVVGDTKENVGGDVSSGAGFYFESGGNNGKDPLLLFPEEIWIMILGNVKDVQDLRSCSRVCGLFYRILEETKTHWLFEKVFPMLFNKLRRKEILNCRQVCKQWCSGIDTVLEKYYTISEPRKGTEFEQQEESLDQPGELKSFHFEYIFNIPPPPPEDLETSSDSESVSTPSSQQSINRCHDKVRSKMMLHPRNPFIGRSVTIEEDSADFDRVEAGLPGSRFVSEAKIFLSDFGQHIWHLSICSNMDIQTPSDFYKVCLESLTKCTNLRTLCLDANLNWRLRRSREIAQINQCPPPMDSAHLETLQVDISNEKIFLIQDKLVEKYCKQLKRLGVQMWNSGLYRTLQWSSLVDLEINKGNADEFLESLKKMKVPNLKKLSIRLDGKGPYLQTLLELSNQFQNLARLDIKFESRFGGISEDELTSLPAGLTSSAKLSSLELTSSVTDILSYNFLMYFPFLQRLLIRHGHWSSYNLLDATSPYFNHLQSASFKAIKKNEIVKIAKYLMQDGANDNIKTMYKSNVWEMLPFLQVLELCNARYVPEKRKVLTRQGYEHYVRLKSAQQCNDM